MKFLRFLLLTLALIAGNIAFAAPTKATEVLLDPTVDSVNTARAVVIRPAAYYHFYVDIYLGSTEKEKPDHRMTGEMMTDGKIVSLTINDEVILGEGETPLLNLPLPKDGVIKFVGVYMTGHAQNGENVSWGSFYSYDFTRGDALLVKMYPNDVSGFVSFVLPAGASSDDFEIILDNNWWGWYDSLFQGFVVRIDPTRGSLGYFVRDRRNGAVVARGVVGPFEKPDTNPAPATSSSFGVVYANGVVDAMLQDRGYSTFDGQQLDGQTVDGGVAKPAKVYFTNIEPGQNLHVSFRGVEGKVEVFGATQTGEMPLLGSATHTISEWDKAPLIRIEDLPLSGHTKLIIKVTGKVVLREGFNAYFSDRFRG